VSLRFLDPGAAVSGERFEPLARSPMEREARAAGARFAARDGWNVATGFGAAADERAACEGAVGWADVSHLPKAEVHGTPEGLAALADAAAGARRLTIRPDLALVIGPRPPALGEAPASVTVVDATTKYAALTVLGPLARELFARFTAIDLRPSALPVGGVRPGSVARTPGLIVREDEERYLMLFGWALGSYMWRVVADAAERLGGAPVGADALAPEEAATRA
jgi:heterotetrameric sarcosine oxidase gamma subunit